MSDHSTTLHFIKAGMHTLIQDLGRPGHQVSGIPISGALDHVSAAAANWCVSNPLESPVLEITMIGPHIQFEGGCQIAITGADMHLQIDGEEVNRYCTITVASGSTLTFGKLRSGCRTYLAVRGAWQIPQWLGSASALSAGKADLVAESMIRKNSTLEVINAEPLPFILEYAKPIASWPDSQTLRVLAGPEFQSFSAQQIAFFFNTQFTITGESNRIGYRLHPSLPEYVAPTELISSGVIPGTIQITREGQPVILLADAQTTGGYPRIANVLSKDLDLLGQLKPGDTVRVQVVKGVKGEG